MLSAAQKAHQGRGGPGGAPRGSHTWRWYAGRGSTVEGRDQPQVTREEWLVQEPKLQLVSRRWDGRDRHDQGHTRGIPKVLCRASWLTTLGQLGWHCPLAGRDGAMITGDPGSTRHVLWTTRTQDPGGDGGGVTPHPPHGSLSQPTPCRAVLAMFLKSLRTLPAPKTVPEFLLRKVSG